MFLFILAIIFLMIATVGFFTARRLAGLITATAGGQYADKRLGRSLARGVAITMLIGGFLAGFFSTFTTVSTKNVGIMTTFGHPDGELSNGAHFIAPWSKVTEMPANVQTDQYLGNTDSDTSNDQQPCMDVRIANQSIACVEVTIRWRIVPGSAPDLFRDYKTFDHVRDSLVTLNLKSALNQAFADYNPLSILQSGSVPQDVLNQVGGKVQQALVKQVGGTDRGAPDHPADRAFRPRHAAEHQRVPSCRSEHPDRDAECANSEAAGAGKRDPVCVAGESRSGCPDLQVPRSGRAGQDRPGVVLPARQYIRTHPRRKVIMKRNVLFLAAALVAAAFTLTACMGDKANEPFKDAPRNGSNGDPALVIYMPDGFSNLATKCVNGDRYTVAYHGDHAYGSVNVVAADPSCPH